MPRGTLDHGLDYHRFMYRTVTFYGRPFQTFSITMSFHMWPVHNPHRENPMGLGLSPFARRYLGNRFFFLFLRVLRCFSSPGMSSITYLLSNRYLSINPSRFPHSEISGSKIACISPKLIAAYHVLRRLLVPRHPPSALISLTMLIKVCYFTIYIRSFATQICSLL